MPHIDVSEELWDQIKTQQARFNFRTLADYFKFCLDIAQTRYWPAVGAIVTRDDREILLVGNDYGGDDLVWNLPGGAVDPGENLIQATVRELYEETGITALEIGSLAWIVQAVLKNDSPFIIGFAFEVTAWEGEISLENEVEHGDVQQVAFVPFDEARECVFEKYQTTLRDWLANSNDTPRIYFSTPDGVRKVK